MSQDLVSLVFADEELAALDAAIATVERFSQSFVSLTAEQVRSLSKMGDRSEPFCRIAPMVFRQYPNALPPSFDLAEMEQDIATFDALRPRALRLRQVMAKFDDTLLAIGSDIYDAARDGYKHMKSAGKSEGLDALRDAFPGRSPRIRKPDSGAA